MSKRAGGGGGEGGGGAATIAVPDDALRMIKDIREITGKQHTDEDIYTVLQDCNMDPNETAQRLLYIDTFHEVKSKRDRRKETSGTKSRWSRGSRENYSATHTYPDAFGRRNATSRRENGASYGSEKGSPASLQPMQGRNDMVSLPVTKDSTIKANGPSSLPNGSSIHRHSPHPDGGVIAKDTPPLNVKKPDSLVPLSAAAPFASNRRTFISVVRDTISAPSVALQAGFESTFICKVGSVVKVAGESHIEANGHASLLPGSELSKNEKVTPRKNSTDIQKDSGKSEVVAKDHVYGTQISSLSKHDDLLCISSSSNDSPSMEESVSQAMVSPEDAQAVATSVSQPKASVLNGYVTFPDHLRVPEALKSGLIFGNFGATPVSGTNHSDGCSYDLNSASTIQLSSEIDEAAQESSSSNESVSTVTHVDHSDKSDSGQHVSEQVPQTETLVFPSADPIMDQSKREIPLDPKGHENNDQVAPDHDSSIISVQGDSAQYVGHEPQAPIDPHLLSYSNENPTSSPNPSLSPPVLNSAAASQPVFLMPPYASNYLQYGHYFNPYFVPMHLVSHSGLPHQQAASPGAKLSLPLSKTISGSTKNPTPILPFYVSVGSSVTGFNPGLAVMPGSSAGDEDLSASQLKEHAVGSLREVSAWVPPQGQDITSLQINSLYHLYPQGQHLFFSPARAGHGPNPGMYQAVQSVAASPVNPPVQQSHVMSASKETIATPSGAQLQTQLAQ